MIVQCEACKTRFRLADEKVKPGGTKVRCSKCKEVFTVMPPEPEPADEAVEFGSFNMEKVTDDAPAEAAQGSESFETDVPEPEQDPTTTPTFGTTGLAQESELDFSAFEAEVTGKADLGDELGDDFSFVDTDRQEEVEVSSEEPGFSFNEQPHQESVEEKQADYGAAFEETEEHGGPVEFDFGEESESAIQTDDTASAAKLSFDDEEAATASEEYRDPDEFSFDDETPFGDDSAAEWSDSAAADDTSFDFDEPRFDSEDTPGADAATITGDKGLQFGEIDFASDSEESTTPGFQSDEDFSKSTLVEQEEPEPFNQRQQSSPPPSRDYDDIEPLPVPPPQKKSALSRILFLLVLLLVVLAGAAGFLFMQEGTLNLNMVARYLPFLQDYIGEAPAVSPGDRIGINIIGSSYVTGKAGQMLVIQGVAINNHPDTRSAITIKGILLDAQGKTLLQQTVFCGNKLDDAELKSMPFAAIEEAMNNQFGDSLSNMNVAAGASIPFTIVFRNLPTGIANINVEVVDSKPGVR
jgi:predicted Zn finger-like uncharacterized protein